MAENKKKIRTLSCCLIELLDEEKIVESTAPKMGFLKSENRPNRIMPESSFTERCKAFLYTDTSDQKEPKWVQILKEGFRIDEHVYTQNSSALFVTYSEKYPDYALCFSFDHGYKWIDKNRLVFDFGRKVVLNSVDPQKISTMDVRSVEDQIKYVKSHVNTESSYKNLFTDYHSLFVHSVCGKPKDSNFAIKVAGTDYLSIHLAFALSDIPELFLNIMTHYLSNKYKSNFPEFEQLKQVRDIKTIEMLEEILCKSLIDMQGEKDKSQKCLPASSCTNDDVSNLFLASPEYSSDEHIEFAFKIKRGRRAALPENRSVDLDLLEYLSLQNEPINIRILKDDKVGVYYPGNDASYAKWSVYECLVFEIKKDEKQYLLLEKKWYEVDDDYNKKLTEEITSMIESQIKLPKSKKKEREDIYNARISSESPQYVNMDKKLYRGQSTPIEVCDLLLKDSHYNFIHIKKKTKSATLSHLFSQGSVSLECLTDKNISSNYIQFINDILAKSGNKSVALPDPIQRNKIKVVYGIITDKTNPANLPFFSKVNLRAYKRLFDRLEIMSSLLLIPYE